MIKFGEFEITLYNFGFFRLDGGSMFGSVPKNIWSKRIPADSENCIKLALRSMVIRTAKRLFLVDVGMGEKWSDKERAIYGLDNFPESTRPFAADEVTDIILTHLHFDHAGGISHRTPQGEIALSYPNARIHVQEANLANALNPNMKERASYLKDNVEPVRSANINLLQDGTEIYPGISGHRVDGHTIGQQWIEVRNGNESIVFPTDLIPTAAHLPVPFHMGYDICAGTILKEKADFLERAEKHNWTVVFQHDAEVESGKVGRDQKGHFCLRA